MNPKLQVLREKANNLPLLPGVYLMKDEQDKIIYVGKAKKLKNRVSSYFHGSHLPKVEAMVDKVADFNVMIVKSEFEALMLENALIKKYQPHYNILLKDDKGYPFISIDMRKEWPRFEISSKKQHRTFGPYGGRGITRDILNAVTHALKLPDCSISFPQQRTCLNYQMGICDGWCVKGDREEYGNRLEQAFMVLDGRGTELIESLRKRMLEASDALNFELAASLRDRIKSIENISNKERVTSGWAERNLNVNETEDNAEKDRKYLKTLDTLGSALGLENMPRRIEAFDVSNLGDSGIVAAMTCFMNGKPLKKGYRKFRIRDLENRDDYSSMYQAVYRRFHRYVDRDEKFSELPDLLLIDGGANHAKIALDALNELGVSLPVFGMVKDDRHRTRALISPYGEEIGIDANQALFSLIGRIQEETHRYAIEYQRRIRYENYGSVLDDIPGVGEKRKADLFLRFKTIKNIREAQIAELSEVVPKDTAKNIYQYFHGESQ